jgi:hypothetical protein
LTDEEAIAHRQSLTKQYPSLPNRAGKLYAQVDLYARAKQKTMAKQLAQPVKVKAERIPKSQRRIRVRALAHPEPNVRLLARALMSVARDMQAEQDEDRGEEKAA